MPRENETLRDYAHRLLTGTGLTGQDAEPVATGTHDDVPDTAHAAADALRAGWVAAARHTTAVTP